MDQNQTAPEAAFYEIRVKGHIDGRRTRWFEGMSVTLLPGGESVISGLVIDQSALYGLLNRIRDLGLPLISVIKL